MAKKRAFIDAVLQVASLSEVFTQDLEDMKDFVQQEQNETMTIEQAKNIKLSFGKYKGKTLDELVHTDGNYCDWLYGNEKTDPVIKKALILILEDAQKQSSELTEKALNKEDEELDSHDKHQYDGEP